MAAPASWPTLPARAAYLVLNNAPKRNALSTAMLQQLRSQLITYNTSKQSPQLRLLPPFKPDLIDELETALHSPDSAARHKDGWLVNRSQWTSEREGLPNVLVLRAEGPVFSAGHDLGEISQLSPLGAQDLFDPPLAGARRRRDSRARDSGGLSTGSEH